MDSPIMQNAEMWIPNISETQSIGETLKEFHIDWHNDAHYF